MAFVSLKKPPKTTTAYSIDVKFTKTTTTDYYEEEWRQFTVPEDIQTFPENFIFLWSCIVRNIGYNLLI
jgi:hypothetical protein